MTKQQAIAYYGSATKLAQALSVSKTAVSLWSDVIPIGRQYQIEVITNGRLKADREQSPITTEGA